MAFIPPFLDQLTLPILVGFVWSVAMWGWPVATVIVMPLFFPLYLVKFTIYGVPFSLVEWFIFIAFVTHLLKTYIQWRRHDEFFFSKAWAFLRQRFGKGEAATHEVRVSSALWVPVILMILSVLVSLFVVPSEADRREVFGILKSWFIAPVLYFYLIIHVLPGLRSIRRCLEWYTISAVLLSFWGIVQFVLGAAITPDGRVSGPFASANYLALYVMPAVVFVVLRLWHLFFVPKDYKGVVGMFMKMFHGQERVSTTAVIRYALAGGIILCALYLTRSFGAFIGLFVALMVYAMYHWFFSPWRLRGRRAFVKFGIFFVGVVTVTTIFFVTSDAVKFKQMFNIKSQSSSSVRLEVWKVSSEFIGEDPIFGIGPGRFEDEYHRRAPEILQKEPYEKEMLHPHNIFLMFWLSAGLLGLISFLWLISVLFYTIAKIDKEDGRKRLGVICGTMLLAILVHGLVDTPIWKNDLALQFWMIAGIIARLRYTA